MKKTNKFEGCEAVLWYNKTENELVLIARGSGDNLDDDNRGVIANPAPFYGMDGKELWDKAESDDFNKFFDKLHKKLKKQYPELKTAIHVEEKWFEWCEANTKEYDCETYALVFDLDKLPSAVQKAVKNPARHTFDIYTSGFDVDGVCVDECDASCDGGLQTTFESETPAVYDIKQLKESVQMAGMSFDNMSEEAINEYLNGFKVIAGC